MKKILTALFVSILLITSSFCTIYADIEIVTQTEKSADLAYLNYYGILSKIGLSAPEDMTAQVTRGDFIVNLYKLMNGENIRFSNQSFSDVSYDIPEVLYAAEYAVAIGAISPSGKFYPNDFITREQAFKIVVIALGYGAEASVRGGWPYGYVYMADKCSLSDGVDDDGVFDGYDMYMLLGNAANTYVNSVSSISPDKSGYVTEIYEISAPLLEVYYDIIHTDGIINASDGGYLYSNEACDSDFVMIGDTAYWKSDGISCPLGYYADVYAQKKDSGLYEIIYADISKNKVVNIHHDEFISITDTSVVYYNEKGNEKRLSMSSDSAFVYNGKAYPAFNPASFSLADGYLRAISNDGDSVADVIEICEPKYLAVRYADTFNNDYELILYDKNNLNHIYITDDTAVYSDRALNDISAGSVVQAYVSKDGLRIQIDILDEIISGTVTALGANGEMYIDDIAYEVTDYFKRFYSNTVTLGAAISVAVNASSRVIALSELPEGTMSLCYLDNIIRKNGVSKAVVLKLFDSSGTVSTPTLSDKVRINGSVVDSASAYTTLQGYVGTMILCNSDSDGYITKINCESSVSGIYNSSSDGNNTLKRYKFPGSDSETKIYYKSFGYFVPHFCISSSTKIFVVAQSENDDSKRFKIGGLSFLGNDTRVNSNSVIPYNVTEDGHAGILLYVTSEAKAPSLTKESSSALVAKCTIALDSDGDKLYKLVLYSSNKFTEYYISAEADFIKNKNLPEGTFPFDVGDYIRYSTDNSGKYIRNATVDFAMKTKSLNANYDDNTEMHYYYGKLYSVGDSSFGILLDNGDIVYLSSGAGDVGVVENEEVNTYPIKRMPTYTQVGDECANILVKCRYSGVQSKVVYN